MPTTLDCRGLSCPQPVLETKKVISQTQPEELIVLVDNQAAQENVSRFLKNNGYVVKIVEADGTFRLSASLTLAPKSKTESDQALKRAQEELKKTLVLISSETFGEGDAVLGAALMGNFLATLSELGPQLWRIVLLNGGVKLTVQEGKALSSLKELAKSGVSILVCGTCLGHYGLLEKKQVGETTNMLDIVSSLSLADKIIKL